MLVHLALLNLLEDLEERLVRDVLVLEGNILTDDLLLWRTVLRDELVGEKLSEPSPDSFPVRVANEVCVHAVRNALKRS